MSLNLEEFKKILEETSNNFNIDPDNVNFDTLLTEFDDDSLFKQQLFIQKVSSDAILPSYAYPTDSGFDLYSTIEVEIPGLSRTLIPTGIKVSFSKNLELQVRPKSGLALNLGLTVLNTPGTIDQGYSGEIKVIVFNTNQHPVKIEKNMKIAQAVLTPVICGGNVNIIEVSNIESKDRGDNGFGSTGIG